MASAMARASAAASPLLTASIGGEIAAAGIGR
jgi:hypothetical protein